MVDCYISDSLRSLGLFGVLRGPHPLELAQSVDVVRDVGQFDFDLCAGCPDSTDCETHRLLLIREDVFDVGALSGFGGVAAPDMGWHCFIRGFAAVDVAGEAVFRDERLILL